MTGNIDGHAQPFTKHKNDNVLKSLNKVRQENEGRILKNFEAMDTIYQRMRKRTNDGIIKLEPTMKK
jgi:hypothetical protein